MRKPRAFYDQIRADCPFELGTLDARMWWLSEYADRMGYDSKYSSKPPETTLIQRLEKLEDFVDAVRNHECMTRYIAEDGYPSFKVNHQEDIKAALERLDNDD